MSLSACPNRRLNGGHDQFEGYASFSEENLDG